MVKSCSLCWQIRIRSDQSGVSIRILGKGSIRIWSYHPRPGPKGLIKSIHIYILYRFQIRSGSGPILGLNTDPNQIFIEDRIRIRSISTGTTMLLSSSIHQGQIISSRGACRRLKFQLIILQTSKFDPFMAFDMHSSSDHDNLSEITRPP